MPAESELDPTELRSSSVTKKMSLALCYQWTLISMHVNNCCYTRPLHYHPPPLSLIELALPPNRAHTPTRTEKERMVRSLLRTLTSVALQSWAAAASLVHIRLTMLCCELPADLACRLRVDPCALSCVGHADDDQREGDYHERRLRNGRPCEDGPPGARQPRRLCDPCLLLLRHRRLRCRPAACPRRC